MTRAQVENLAYNFRTDFEPDMEGTEIRDVIHHGHRLFKQWVIDMYFKVQDNNLNYIAQHQDDFRREERQGLMDAVESDPENANASQSGRRVILPSSFTGNLTG